MAAEEYMKKKKELEKQDEELSKIENIVRFSEAKDGVVLIHTTDINSSIILSDNKEKSLLN